ncbi:MAG: hypothetical protein AB1432_10830 [Bacteroidota bacterium]
MKKLIVLFVLFVFILPNFAQEKEHETSSEVKELGEFHDVIYQVWHTAWPQKDIKLLISLLPQVEEKASNIVRAKLPGILRDKKPKWDEGVKKFMVYVGDYRNAAAIKDSVGLLKAAEKVHAQFEMLVRIIRPVTKEVDAFHQVLYMLYHYYMPEYQYDKIKEAAKNLKEKSDDLIKSKLPDRLKAKSEQFDKVKTELAAAVEKLNKEVAAGSNKEKINSAVDEVHSKYEELEHVFN